MVNTILGQGGIGQILSRRRMAWQMLSKGKEGGMANRQIGMLEGINYHLRYSELFYVQGELKLFFL